MIGLNADVMRRIAPPQSGSRAVRQTTIIGAIGPVLQVTCAEYAIDTGLRASHFLAQTCHESDSFCTIEEYASGKAYEGRADLGNTQPGDGPRFKGRGLIQLTGRANYQRYGDFLSINLVGNPEMAADPQTSLRIACMYWTQNDLNTAADADDLVAVTRRINGGLNGIDSRRACLAAAKLILNVVDDLAEAPLLRVGSSGPSVVRMQNLLRARGYMIRADGAFGPTTRDAVIRFQTSKGLAADGVIGPATWSALGASAAD